MRQPGAARRAAVVALLVAGGPDLLRAQSPTPAMPAPEQPSTWQAPGPAAPPRPARDRAPGEPARGTSLIQGHVVSADTGTPLRRAVVQANEMRGLGSALTQTDADGRFELRDLPAGRFAITASHSGFVSMQVGQKTPTGSGTLIEVAEGQRLDRVLLALPRAAAVSGRVDGELRLLHLQLR